MFSIDSHNIIYVSDTYDYFRLTNYVPRLAELSLGALESATIDPQHVLNVARRRIESNRGRPRLVAKEKTAPRFFLFGYSRHENIPMIQKCELSVKLFLELIGSTIIVES